MRILGNLSIESDFMSLPPEFVRDLLEEYDARHDTNFADRNQCQCQCQSASSLQSHAEKLGLQAVCPHCGCERVKRNGKFHGTQRYLCQNSDCGRTFTLLSGTFLGKSRWSWELWVRLFQLTIGSTTIRRATEILSQEFGIEDLTQRSVFLARHKLIHALNCMPFPKLRGAVQIDELYLRENQKGTRTDLLDENGQRKFPLVNVIPGYMNDRVPRYSIQPSLLGVTSPEYLCTVYAVDETGHAVAATTNFGKLTVEQLMLHFDSQLKDVDFLCSDSNNVYTDYCRSRKIRHYIRPNNYLFTLYKAGFSFRESVTFESAEERQKVMSFLSSLKKERITSNYGERHYLARAEKKNIHLIPDKMRSADLHIVQALYYDKRIDYIDDEQLLPFIEFCEIKEKCNLNLEKSNYMHDFFLTKLDVLSSGIASKHFPEYVGALLYLHNWEVDNGHVPQSKTDIESIMVKLLQCNSSLTMSEIENRSFFVAPAPSEEYIAQLDYNSRRVRHLLDNKFFKFDEEDHIVSFDWEKCLSQLPTSQLRIIAINNAIPDAETADANSLIKKVLELENAEQIIYKLIAREKVYGIYSEDAKYLKSHKLTIQDLSYSKKVRGTILENQSVLKSSEHHKEQRVSRQKEIGEATDAKSSNDV